MPDRGRSNDRTQPFRRKAHDFPCLSGGAAALVQRIGRCFPCVQIFNRAIAVGDVYKEIGQSTMGVVGRLPSAMAVSTSGDNFCKTDDSGGMERARSSVSRVA